MNRFMIAIETLGNAPNAPIVEIGAARFDDYYNITDEITIAVKPESFDGCSAETLAWWFEQSEPSRKNIAHCLRNGDSLYTALNKLKGWLNVQGSPDEVWAKGAAFDLAILRYWYSFVGMDMPWKYSTERCMRTLNCWPFAYDTSERPTHVAAEDVAIQIRQLEHFFGVIDSMK